MIYGKAIRLLRASRGFSQRELAKKLRLDSSYVSLLEGGKRTPSLKVLTSIATVLNVPAYLVLLLASEKRDLRGVGAAQAQKLGVELLRALTPLDGKEPKQ